MKNALPKVDFRVDLVQKDLEYAVPVSPFHTVLNSRKGSFDYERIWFSSTVTLGCGASTDENLTYFEQLSTISSGPCGLRVCKINANICQVTFYFCHKNELLDHCVIATIGF